MNLIQDIVLARREKGLTQKALAEAIGSDRAAIARLEAGVGPLSLLLQIMEALQYHVAGLAKGTMLPEQLRNRRLSMKLSTQELAQRAGVSRATISALERGNGTIAPLVKVLDILCTSTTARRKPTPSLWLP
ncbi:MAG: helix-turn-helix domain-containing protein, partial [Alphaproteobacteria bacterium]